MWIDRNIANYKKKRGLACVCVRQELMIVGCQLRFQTFNKNGYAFKRRGVGEIADAPTTYWNILNRTSVEKRGTKYSRPYTNELDSLLEKTTSYITSRKVEE